MVKVEIEEAEKGKYPMLMVSDMGRIILATGEGSRGIKGTIIKDPSGRWSVGESSDDWATGALKPFHGKITLSNRG